MQHPAVRALDGVSFDVGAGDAVAIVGESGCGKTTLGRLMLKLVEPTAGSIAFDGAQLAGLGGEGLRAFRRQAQLVFQNPFDALNPRFTIYRAVAEPLLNAGIDKAEHMDRVAAAFRRVHLPDLERYLDKYPHQLSGGQLQRVVLARALVLTPRFLVADEPVSMLDVSVRAGILALMREVRDTHRIERRLHLPRSRPGALPLRAHPGDVSRPHRRGWADRRDRAAAAASLHAGAGRGRAGARRRPVARPAADQGQRAGRARAALGLQLPRSLPPRDGPLCRGGTPATRGRRRPSRGLSSRSCLTSITSLQEAERPIPLPQVDQGSVGVGGRMRSMAAIHMSRAASTERP